MTLSEARALVQAADIPAELTYRAFKLSEGDALEQVSSAISEERGVDKFLEHELDLAALLLMLWMNEVEEYGLVDKLNTAADSNNREQVKDALDEAHQNFSDLTDTDEDDSDIEGILENALVAGAAVLGLGEVARRTGAAIDFIRQYRARVQYYANHYLRRVVHPMLMDAVDAQIAENALNAVNLREAIKKGISRGVMHNAAYWRLVSNQATGRAHHYGILRASQDRSVVAYQLIAVIDKRTSKICEKLHRKIFRVADGLEHLDKVARTDPEQVAAVAPWVKAKDIENLSNADLRKLGVLVPPFHPHCRTTLKPIYG